MENLVDLSFVQRQSIPHVGSKRPLQVFTVDGRALRSGLVTQERHQTLAIGQHSECLILRATSLGRYPVF